MENKVVLILVDGMRPDGMVQCGSATVERLLKNSTYTLEAQTVMPSVTLPCHMSLFHSVTPERHGITTNIYTPQVRPINGLCEQLDEIRKQSVFFYTWDELKDLSRPGSIAFAMFRNMHYEEDTDRKITADFIDYLKTHDPDFTFLYFGETDEMGHDCGWMGEQYEKTVCKAMDCVGQVMDVLPENYTMFLVADHGGHDRAHGADIPEDMTIPVVCYGNGFEKNVTFDRPVSIIDIAPTIAKLLGATPAREWEGKSLL